MKNNYALCDIFQFTVFLWQKMLVEFVCHEIMGITAHRNLKEIFPWLCLNFFYIIWSYFSQDPLHIEMVGYKKGVDYSYRVVSIWREFVRLAKLEVKVMNELILLSNASKVCLQLSNFFGRVFRANCTFEFCSSYTPTLKVLKVYLL